MLRHVAVSRHVGNLDFNNTYQYVIAREETQLAWLRSAIEDFGGVAPAPGAEPAVEASKDADLARRLIADDARTAREFIARWTSRVEQVTNARQRLMLRVILGETLEHQRFFEQASAGREDLLGRRLDAGPRRGQVVGSRWQGD